MLKIQLCFPDILKYNQIKKVILKSNNISQYYFYQINSALVSRIDLWLTTPNFLTLVYVYTNYNLKQEKLLI